MKLRIWLLPFFLLCAQGASWAQNDSPPPPPAGLGAQYLGQRKIQLHWRHAATGPGTTLYDVYCDGNFLETVTGRESDPETGGERWLADSTHQYYRYFEAWPERTHVFQVITRSPGGAVSEPAGVSIAIPAVNVSGAVAAFPQGGRVVRLSWLQISERDFPVSYRIHRDGEHIASFAQGAGSAENGDSWNFSWSSQEFYDRHATPGALHEYRVVAVFFEGYENTRTASVQVPAAAISRIDTRFHTGRKLSLSWPSLSGAGFEVKYEVHRDGVPIATFDQGNGEDAQGFSWHISYGDQYFVDLTAIPGRTHEYLVSARLYDGFAISATAACAIPEAALKYLGAYAGSGRTVQLNWTYPRGEGFANSYRIRRDGVLIAEFPQGTGENDAGSSWRATANEQYFTDAKAIPGREHVYTVECSLFAGFTIQSDVAATVKSVSLNVVGDAWSGRKTRLSWSQVVGSGLENPEYEIRRDGAVLARFAPGNGANTAGYWELTYPSGVATQRFFDLGAIPGETHSYTVSADFSGGFELEGAAEIAVAGVRLQPNAGTATSGRVATLTWTPINGEGLENPRYRIFRDGELIHEFAAGTGSSEDGYSWKILHSGGFQTQYFHDGLATPGAVHSYRVEAILFDGFAVSGETEASIPDFQAPYVRGVPPARQDRGVLLRWEPVRGEGFSPVYTILRNGERIARFPAGNGEGENGDTWSIGVFQQYIDPLGYPGKNNLYEVITEPFPGFEARSETTIPVPPPAGSLFTDAYFPVIKRFPSGEYLLGATIHAAPMTPERAGILTLELGGYGVIFADNGLATLDVDTAEFSGDGLYNVYLVAPADLDIENASITLQVKGKAFE